MDGISKVYIVRIGIVVGIINFNEVFINEDIGEMMFGIILISGSIIEVFLY